MHPSLENILRWFKYDHLPAGVVRDASLECSELAHHYAELLPSSPELVAGLRKLLEAKDCFVRAAVAFKEEIKA